MALNNIHTKNSHLPLVYRIIGILWAGSDGFIVTLLTLESTTPNFGGIIGVMFFAPMLAIIFGWIPIILCTGLGFLIGRIMNRQSYGIEAGLIGGLISAPIVVFGIGRMGQIHVQIAFLIELVGIAVGRVLGNALGVFLARRNT